MNMQSMVWCSTSPSTLKNSALTSGLSPLPQTRRDASIASMTVARAWAYRLCTRPSRFAPCDRTRCCVARGTSLSERGDQRWAGIVQLPIDSMPSTHAWKSGSPLSAGPEKTRHASVNSGPDFVEFRRSYCQYASEVTLASSRYSSWQLWTSEPDDGSPAARHSARRKTTPDGVTGSS